MRGNGKVILWKGVGVGVEKGNDQKCYALGNLIAVSDKCGRKLSGGRKGGGEGRKRGAREGELGKA